MNKKCSRLISACIESDCLQTYLRDWMERNILRISADGIPVVSAAISFPSQDRRFPKTRKEK
jgi:hypothetical protein